LLPKNFFGLMSADRDSARELRPKKVAMKLGRVRPHADRADEEEDDCEKREDPIFCQFGSIDQSQDQKQRIVP
jgi:hypothetical protein